MRTYAEMTVDGIEKKIITEEEYNNIIDSCKFFKKLGGVERSVRNYTCRGFKVVKLTSISPDKETKVIREFNFDVI
jgi:hypothetical protein